MNIQEMLKLAKGWDTYDAEAPNETAARNVNWFIESLDIEPASLHPSAEGGIMLRYGDTSTAVGSVGAYVECYNDGEIGYSLIRNGQVVASTDMYEDRVNPKSFVEAVRKHLLGETSSERAAVSAFS